MGICINEAKLILRVKKYNHQLGKVATIGRQNLFLTDNDIRSTLRSTGISEDEISSLLKKDNTYCENYLQLLGADSVDSIDVSDYEKSTIIHDMNSPIPKHFHFQYDTIIDNGTLEHVFNFPIAIKNCMEMVKVGGMFVGVTPANNFFGHGFYQFSPEAYFRIFSEENGFAIRNVILYSDDRKGYWYELKDPKEVANRITLINRKPMLLFVAAQKTNNTIPFLTPPIQSDYNDLRWQKKGMFIPEVFQVKGILAAVKKAVPLSVKEGIVGMRNKFKTIFSEIGNLDPHYYKKSNKN